MVQHWNLPKEEGRGTVALCEGSSQCTPCFDSRTEPNLRSTSGLYFRVLELEWHWESHNYAVTEKIMRLPNRHGLDLSNKINASEMEFNKLEDLNIAIAESLQDIYGDIFCQDDECEPENVTATEVVSALFSKYGKIPYAAREHVIRRSEIAESFQNAIFNITRTGRGIETRYIIAEPTQDMEVPGGNLLGAYNALYDAIPDGSDLEDFAMYMSFYSKEQREQDERESEVGGKVSEQSQMFRLLMEQQDPNWR